MLRPLAPLSKRFLSALAAVVLLSAGRLMAQDAPPVATGEVQSGGEVRTEINVLAAAPAEPVTPAPFDPAVDGLLARMYAVGTDLRDFRCGVTLTQIDPTFQDESSRLGKVVYERRSDGNGRIRVTFDRRQSDGRIFEEQVEYLLEDGWLTDRNYRTQTQVKRQVLRPGEKLDLLKLGEGPFPLPIGQRPDDVRRMFTVELIPSTEDDPAGTAHLRLTPRPETTFSTKFNAIEVWIDKETAMPRRVRTSDPRRNVAVTDFDGMQLNVGVAAADFILPTISGWDESTEPFND